GQLPDRRTDLRGNDLAPWSVGSRASLPDPHGIGSIQRDPRAQGGAGRFRRGGSAAGEMTEPSRDARYSNWRFQPDLRLTTSSFRCIGIVIIPSDLQRATARAPRSPTAWHRSPSASKSSTAPAGSRGTRSTAAET